MTGTYIRGRQLRKWWTWLRMPILLLIPCLFILSACDKEHDEVVFSNPFDPDNPETHGEPYNLYTEAKSGSIQVQWNEIPNTDGVVIYRSMSPDSGFARIGTSSSEAYVDTDVQAGETYYYQVRAYRGKNDAPPSALTDRSRIAANTLPESTIVSHKLESNVLSVEWAGIDKDGSVAGYSTKLDDGEWTDVGLQMESRFDELSDGEHIFYVKAYDNLGSYEKEPQSIEFTVESAPPVNVGITINGGASVTNSRNVLLALPASDASQMRISNTSSFTDNWIAYQNSKNWTLSAGEGAKTVYAQFRDKAGNVSTTVSASITLNDQAPGGSIVINGGANTTISSNVTLSLSAPDATEMRISNTSSFTGAWKAYQSSTNWTLSAGNGTKIVYAQFRDAAGNVSAVVSATIELNIITESLQGLWCSTIYNGESTQKARLEIYEGESSGTIEIYVTEVSGFYWNDVDIWKSDGLIDIDIELPAENSIDIYLELALEDGHLVGTVQNLYGGDEELPVTFARCHEDRFQGDVWCGNSYNDKSSYYMELYLDRSGSITQGTVFFPFNSDSFDLWTFHDILQVSELGSMISFVIHFADLTQQNTFNLQFQDGNLIGNYEDASGVSYIVELDPCSESSPPDGHENPPEIQDSVFIDFEDGSLKDWEVVDEEDVDDEWPSSDWKIRDSQLGLDGKALYQDSIIWGDSTDSCLMGTFIIYKGRRFTNFVMEVEVATDDTCGMGLVWGYEGTDRHYRAIMINDEWPETPVDGISGPFMKISKRISDKNPWYETLTVIKKGYTPYAQNTRLHWMLEVQDGTFTFIRSDGSIITASDSEYSGGYVGIQLYVQTAEFDNISIVPLADIITIDIDIKPMMRNSKFTPRVQLRR